MAILDLLFLQSHGTNPRAHIFVSEYSRHAYSGHEGKILIGSECATPREVDEVVDHLIRDLEAIRKSAKAKFRS